MTTLIDPLSTANVSPSTGRLPRLLLVAYNFPPVGGAGVQRPVKWVKNLRRFGWDVTVLTTENPSVPAYDESLLADIPEDVLVVRARTWEPDYKTKRGLETDAKNGTPNLVARVKSSMKRLVKQAVKLALQPDPQVLWVPNAIKAGKRVLRELNHDAILVTAPAYSSFFIGTSLKKQFGIPLVLDFRDEWDMSGQYLENAQRDLFSRVIQDRMQKHLLRQADAVVATTKASTKHLTEKLARLNKPNTRTATIYNGFDAEEFESHATEKESSTLPSIAPTDPTQSEPRKPFRLLYTGTLWNLTTIEPLVIAVLRLNESSPHLVSRLELVCVGRKTPEQSAILERVKQTGCQLNLIDYCEHSKVLDWLRSTDAVCLLLSDVRGADRVVPAKLFEYLANRKDMLAIVPKGETADIVQRFFPDGNLEPKNIDGIVDWLKCRLAGGAPSKSQTVETADIEEFSRATQTGNLVTLLNELIPVSRSNEKDVQQ